MILIDLYQRLMMWNFLVGEIRIYRNSEPMVLCSVFYDFFSLLTISADSYNAVQSFQLEKSVSSSPLSFELGFSSPISPESQRSLWRPKAFVVLQFKSVWNSNVTYFSICHWQTRLFLKCHKLMQNLTPWPSFFKTKFGTLFTFDWRAKIQKIQTFTFLIDVF